MGADNVPVVAYVFGKRLPVGLASVYEDGSVIIQIKDPVYKEFLWEQRQADGCTLSLNTEYKIGPGMKLWVTKNNHVWAAEESGLSLEEIKKLYDEARAKKIICTIEVANHGTTVWSCGDDDGNAADLNRCASGDDVILTMTAGRWSGYPYLHLNPTDMNSLWETLGRELDRLGIVKRG